MKGASEMTEFIRERLEDGKHRQYGEEPVSELVHALQCATLAEDEGADDELVVAALLHDFGRLVVEDGDLSDSVGGDGETPPKHGGHGELGAEQLHEHFSDRIPVLHPQPRRGEALPVHDRAGILRRTVEGIGGHSGKAGWQDG